MFPPEISTRVTTVESRVTTYAQFVTRPENSPLRDSAPLTSLQISIANHGSLVTNVVIFPVPRGLPTAKI